MLEKHPGLNLHYIPIELSFHIANLNTEDVLYFNSLNIHHQLKKDSRWRPVRYELSRIESLDDSISFEEPSVDPLEAESNEILHLLDNSEENEISEVAVRNLGVYSVEDQNEDFLLTHAKIPISESGVSFFKMIFFVEKTLFHFFDYLELGDSQEEQAQSNGQRIALRSGNEDFNGEKNVRLQVNIKVSAAGDDAEFGETWYYYYK